MPFTGRAIYDDGVFDGVAEDVSDVISMISPFETPLLDRLTQAPRAAFNVLHEWLEDQLTPNTVVTSTAIASVTTTTSVAVHDGSGSAVAGYLQVGDVMQSEVTGEYFQIAAISSNNINLTREFGGTSAGSLGAGTTLFVISSAALEGADVSGDISRPRVRVNNYAQIFKRDIIISGTMQSVQQLGGITNELDYQRTQRLREAVRDLEKAMIRGKTSGNSLGSSTAYRTMRGILDFISTNVASASTLTPEILNDTIRLAWDNGGTDLDLIVADAAMKRLIDQFNSTRVEVMNRDNRFHNMVSIYESTFGQQEVILSRWMPANTLMVISTQRVHAVPLRGRSFQFQPVSRTGDAEKGMIIGEYTAECKNQTGLAQLIVS